MSAHALATAAVLFDARRANRVRAALKTLGVDPGGGAQKKLLAAGVFHFATMSVVDVPGDKSRLVIELSADGDDDLAALLLFAQTLDAELAAVLHAAGERKPAEWTWWLKANRLRPSPLSRRSCGLLFDGSPDMSVRRILREQKLAAWIEERPALLKGPGSPDEKLAHIRNELWKTGEWTDAFVAKPAAILAPPPEPATSAGYLRVLLALVEPFARALAPLAVAAPVAFLLAPGLTARVVLVVLVLLVVSVALLAGAVRRSERSDPSPATAPDAAAASLLHERESHTGQNILMTTSVMKPGALRRVLLALALEGVRRLLPLAWAPGRLAQLDDVHFARWLKLPGTNLLIFRSNYDGSWLSYLEDFVAHAPTGVSAIWSNTQGFPRTRWLVLDGAADGPRFLRWARTQTRPAAFWFSAYPTLSMERMRLNARVARAVATCEADPLTRGWLAGLGAAKRPDDALETAEIPTLLFGGLSHLPCATALFVTLGGGANANRAWLKAVAAELTYGHASGPHAAALGLSATGLEKLDRPGVVAAFPTAFQSGMVAPGRSRALGDVGYNDPRWWRWGGEGSRCDAVILLYSKDEAALTALVARHVARLPPNSSKVVLKLATRHKPTKDMREPFGFTDGISQPVLQGAKRARHGCGGANEVEPGEFVLGYPGSGGKVAASPLLDPGFDPARRLPPAPPPDGAPAPRRRDLGRNGTFLVVRQLRQDVDAFKRYTEAEAGAAGIAQELVAAKMMGRWRNGSSLVRHPHAAGRSRDNGFSYAAEDPLGLACPLGAHIRRANPRDSLAASSGSAPEDEIATVNRHRLLRVGRPYGALDQKVGEKGMLFMCLNADIEKQFELVQQSWLLRPDFHGLRHETDPLVARSPSAHPASRAFTVPSPEGPGKLKDLPDFVTVKGGGYFFMPGRAAVRFLAEG